MSLPKYKVGLLIVTFNRLELLKRLIFNLSEIDYPLNEILIFDNNSDYDSSDLSFANDFIFMGNPKITIYKSKINIGGSGGFHEGIKMLLESNDFIWTMDDDVVFTSNSLSELIMYSNNQFVTVPVKYNKKNQIIDVTSLVINLNNCFLCQHRKGFVKDLVIERSVKTQRVESFSFEGALFPSHVIEMIGLPERDYFICHDDLEYSFRLKESDIGILLCYDAICYREYEIDRFSNFFTWKSFYAVRNYFWVHKKHHGRIYWFFRPLFFSLVFLFISLIKLKIKNARTIYRGILSGFSDHS